MPSPSDNTRVPSETESESGYSLLELLVSIAILCIVSGTAMEGVFRLSKTSQTISNRVEMHSGVRNATELLQQEVGQAGRIALPNLVQLQNQVAIGSNPVVLKAVDAAGNTIAANLANPTDSMFVGERLTIDTGTQMETATITAYDPSARTITANFLMAHAANAPVTVAGGFAYGVVPKHNANGGTFTNGSTGFVMKVMGDINSDGKLMYVEYVCDTATGNLYRRTRDYKDTTKPAVSADMALLNNITQNPNNGDCFTYQELAVNGVQYVVDVAITLTVKTPDKDPVTGLYQTETKALLNVSPRNVFNVWQLASQQIPNRVQPDQGTLPSMLPGNVSTLIGLP
jgi:prepilin-type N-terminal cleavage/methylation domain-containing protein